VRVPRVHGIIRRRLLVNFRVDPVMIQRLLPPRFRPKLHDGHAVAGICLIRLEQIRPRRFPSIVGVSSENAAHRIAVTGTTARARASTSRAATPARCSTTSRAAGSFPASTNERAST
jgi:hypothetical protein